MTEEFQKQRYEPPIMIDLGSMAKGKGLMCDAGYSDVTGDYCRAGPNNTVGYCSAGLNNTGTYCSAGNLNATACSAGPSPVV